MGERYSFCEDSRYMHLPGFLPYFCAVTSVVGKSDVLWGERVIDCVEIEGRELKYWLE